jgi:hypothetical protein
VRDKYLGVWDGVWSELGIEGMGREVESGVFSLWSSRAWGRDEMGWKEMLGKTSNRIKTAELILKRSKDGSSDDGCP